MYWHSWFVPISLKHLHQTTPILLSASSLIASRETYMNTHQNKAQTFQAKCRSRKSAPLEVTFYYHYYHNPLSVAQQSNTFYIPGGTNGTAPPLLWNTDYIFSYFLSETEETEQTIYLSRYINWHIMYTVFHNLVIKWRHQGTKNMNSNWNTSVKHQGGKTPERGPSSLFSCETPGTRAVFLGKNGHKYLGKVGKRKDRTSKQLSSCPPTTHPFFLWQYSCCSSWPQNKNRP